MNPVSAEDSPSSRRRSRREREHERHMDEIVRAAEFLFAEKGYAAATMEDIAQRAEFAVGTLYRFFPGKSELYAETISRGLRQRELEVHETLSSDESPRGRIERYLHCRMEQFWKNPNFFRLFFQGTDRANCNIPNSIVADLTDRYEKIKQRLREIFAEGIRQGQFQDFDEEVLTVVLEGFIRGYVTQLTLEAEPVRNEDLERQLIQLFLHGAAGHPNPVEGVH